MATPRVRLFCLSPKSYSLIDFEVIKYPQNKADLALVGLNVLIQTPAMS